VNANHIEGKDNAIADGLSRVGSDCYEFIQRFIVKLFVLMLFRLFVHDIMSLAPDPSNALCRFPTVRLQVNESK
jgi:hypothetical protein